MASHMLLHLDPMLLAARLAGGCSLSRIAREVGRSTTTVRRHRNKYFRVQPAAARPQNGRKNPFYRRRHDAETRQRISKAVRESVAAANGHLPAAAH